MWPGVKSLRRRYTWVEFVVGFLLCCDRFFSGYSGFALSSKTNISKFQFDQESGRRRTTLWMCYLQIIIYFCLFIFLDLIVSQKRLKHTENQTKYRNNTRADQTSSNVNILIYWNWAIAVCVLTAVIEWLWANSLHPFLRRSFTR